VDVSVNDRECVCVCVAIINGNDKTVAETVL
jgi:hypothetical protein